MEIVASEMLMGTAIVGLMDAPEHECIGESKNAGAAVAGSHEPVEIGLAPCERAHPVKIRERRQ